MAVRSAEIRDIIKQEIEGFDQEATITNVGSVIEVGDGIARVYGLSNVQSSELVEFLPSNGETIVGMALNLEEDNVGVIIFGDYTVIEEGTTVRTTGRIAEVPVGDALIGRVVNAIGQPIDDKGPLKTDKFRPIERIAPGVITRKSVNTPVQTGVKAIDAIIPIGRGQRELIIGDRQTGKTAVCIDTIINQKGKNLICIYVAIGQKSSTVARTIAVLEEHGAMEYTIIVVAGAAGSPPLK